MKNTATKRKERTRPSQELRPVRLETDNLRLVVKREGGVALIPVSEIESLEADGNVVVVRTQQVTHRIRAPLSGMLEKLSGLGFVRIHRSIVVRVASVTGIEKGAYRKAFVVLRSGAKLEIGRAEFPRLRALWQPGLLDLSDLSTSLHLVDDDPLPGA